MGTLLGLGSQRKWCHSYCLVIAIILHMKWGRLISNRGLMIMTVLSNVVCAHLGKARICWVLDCILMDLQNQHFIGWFYFYFSIYSCYNGSFT